MFKAVKECLKNWLKTHERLYWYIVVGLAVLAFGVITAIGCAKLEKAEAATTSDGVYYPNLLTEVDLGEHVDMVHQVLDTYSYILVSRRPQAQYNDWYFYFANTPFVIRPMYSYDSSRNDEISSISHGGYIHVSVKDSRYICDIVKFDWSSNIISINAGTSPRYDLIGSNCLYGVAQGNEGKADYVASLPQNNIVHPNDYIETVYSVDAPYIKGITNGNINNFMLDGIRDFNESYFTFRFDISDDGSEFEQRKVSLSGHVYLPSKKMIDEAVAYYQGGRDTLSQFHYIDSGDYYPVWMKSLDIGDGSTFKKWNFSLEYDLTDTNDLMITHETLYHLIEQYNNVDLMEYYGISEFFTDILKGYMWVQRLDGFVYTTYSDSIVYGNLSSFVFSNYIGKTVVSYGNSDPLFMGPMLPDNDVQQNINQAYKDALDQAVKENESLNDSLNGYLDTNGAYGNLEGSDLWTSFRSLSEGLASLSPSVRAIASLTGAVLAFLPLQVTGIITFTLLALCIVAIIKAIRG